MEHNVSINIVGQNKHDVTVNLEHWFDSIVNATADMHYLYWKQTTYAKIENAIHSQSIICFNDIKYDYDKYIVNAKNTKYDIVNIDMSITNILKTTSTDKKKIEAIKSYLALYDGHIENTQQFSQIWYDELEQLYNKCTEFINKGYNDIVINYSILH